ncbi:MAG: gliding motility-associated C-terminal domain-containing protein [Bacteroidota bacterium]|nr:gliding motility-associated C-terminal domain-containing protein [Bacteroidota bacterium]
MNKWLLFLFILTGTCQLMAQRINAGWVYGGTGIQRATQCFIDNAGNRYQVIIYSADFVIDSAGSPITIQKNPNTVSYVFSTVIVKFDTLGKYLFHVRFLSAQGGGASYENLDLKFNATNEVFLCYTFLQRDSIDIFDSHGILYKKLILQYNRRATDNNCHTAIAIFKLNPSGQFIWMNSIARETLPGNLGSARCANLIVSSANEIRIYFPNIRADSSSIPDTLSVTNYIGQKTMFFVNTQYVLFKFSFSGTLLSFKEPLKNHLSYIHADSSYYRRDINMVTDGNNSYIILGIYITRPDTFKSTIPVPLKPGYNYLLIKLNEQDSILWVKPIIRNISFQYPLYNFEYDTIKQELFLIVPYRVYLHEFLLNPSFSNSNEGTYLCKISSGGNVLWEELYENTWLYSVNLNYKTRQHIFGGYNINSLKLQKYMPSNPLNKPFAFVAFADSLNNIYAAQPILNNLTNLSYIVQFNYLTNSSITTDLKGRLYISGWFADSISLPCKKLHATLSTDLSGNPLDDGFVLMLRPDIPIEAQACKSILSPSTKYTWDSTGYYFDTIPNYLGCDSILLYRVNILTTKSILDTAVCINMRSYSSKYLWDSTGTYQDTIPNTKYCDSIITVHLTILQTSNAFDTTVKFSLIAPSGKYLWDSSGVFYDTIPNSRGCDSILKVRLTVLLTKSNIDTVVCRSFISPSGKYFYTSTGMYFDTIPNKIGGDSIITISLNVLQTYNVIDTTFCGSYLSPSGRYNWNISGIYYDTIPNNYNCDSIITIQFTKTITIDTVSIQSCNSFTSPSGKYVYSISGEYRDTVLTVQNCDSIIVIQYKRLITQSNFMLTVCDTIVSPSGKYTYSVSGQYQDTILNSVGCDSIMTINLVLQPINLSLSKSNNISCENPFALLNADGGYTYLWYPAIGLSNANIANPIAYPDTNTFYFVITQDTLGCTAYDSIEILVNKAEVIRGLPNVFTPNDDGINDCLPLTSVVQFEYVEFVVFNRWGTTVFSTNSQTGCWDGKLNTGQDVSEGVYFFILNGTSQCDQKINQRGTITVIR